MLRKAAAASRSFAISPRTTFFLVFVEIAMLTPFSFLLLPTSEAGNKKKHDEAVVGMDKDDVVLIVIIDRYSNNFCVTADR